MIGGLLVATFATLMFVPCVFALLHQRRSTLGEVAHESTHWLDDRVACGAGGGIAGLAASWSRERALPALTRIGQ